MDKQCKSISPEEVRNMFDYDPVTARFVWKMDVSNVKAGTKAGVKNTSGYLVVRLRKRLYYQHRLIWAIMTGAWPSSSIDHINCDRSDNRWANLRQCSESQNRQNAQIRKDNLSGFKGVKYKRDRKKKFAAVIRLDGKSVHLGAFYTPEEAHQLYCIKAKEFFGEFARFD